MDINHTIEAKVVKTSVSTAGINISPATRHHYRIEPGDTVIVEIKDVIKANHNMPQALIDHGTSFVQDAIRSQLYPLPGEV